MPRMERPCVLLLPEFTEVEWTIRPLLAEWATVRSYDPPYDRPLSELSRQDLVARGLAELDALGCEKAFLVADGWGIPTAAHVAARRRDAIAGLACGHARLSNRHDGTNPPINPQVYAAMTQLIETDAPAFVRFGIAQVTGGSVDEQLAQRMLERLPVDAMAEGWAAITADEQFGEVLAALDCPLLFAKHEGCLMSTEEGFADAVARIPRAETVVASRAPTTSPQFAEALREFCVGTHRRR
jgi:pimeloyl-ACP methyl ester carboxylesterase